VAPLAQALARAVRRAGDGAMAASGVAVVAMMLLVTGEVLGRNVLNVSILVADEVAAYLLVAMTFVGLAPTLRDGGFIRLDAFLVRTRGARRRAFDLGIVIVAAAYTAILDWYLWALALKSFELGTTSIQVSRTPLWIPQVVMAAGGLFLLFELLARFALVVTGQEAEVRSAGNPEL
jgi:TRAP-type C4-dicarboxylate transport system permease small subunit